MRRSTNRPLPEQHRLQPLLPRTRLPQRKGLRVVRHIFPGLSYLHPIRPIRTLRGVAELRLHGLRRQSGQFVVRDFHAGWRGHAQCGDVIRYPDVDHHAE